MILGPPSGGPFSVRPLWLQAWSGTLPRFEPGCWPSELPRKAPSQAQSFHAVAGARAPNTSMLSGKPAALAGAGYQSGVLAGPAGTLVRGAGPARSAGPRLVRASAAETRDLQNLLQSAGRITSHLSLETACITPVLGKFPRQRRRLLSCNQLQWRLAVFHHGWFY